MKRKTTAFILLMLFAGVVTVAFAGEGEGPGVGQPLAQDVQALHQLLPNAKECASCHQDHFAAWQRSYHALSIKTGGFKGGFKGHLGHVERQQGKVGRDDYMACFYCHAPALRFAADAMVKEVADGVLKGALEPFEDLGVTCSVCHRIGPDGQMTPYGVNKAFYGPIQDPQQNLAHASLYSARHQQAQVCQECHEWRTPFIPCSSVYNDWVTSQAAQQGHQCQACHMAAEPGKAAQDGPDRTIYAHNWPGGRSELQLLEAMEMTIEATRQGNQLMATVVMKNTVPHSIPNG